MKAFLDKVTGAVLKTGNAFAIGQMEKAPGRYEEVREKKTAAKKAKAEKAEGL